MRVALAFGVAPHDVLAWPVSSLRLAMAYLAVEPAPVERVEMSIAQLSAIYVNAHRKKGSQPHKLTEFLLFYDAWKPADPEPGEGLGGLLLSFGRVRKRGDDHR